ncbi:MAG: efflux RND transporter periplasmic adaptor subunit [Pseudomonadota bacterium]
MTFRFFMKDRRVGLCALAVAGLLSACGSGSDDMEERPPRPVEWRYPTSYDQVARTLYSGRVVEAQTSDLAFEVAGTIATLDVDRGDRFTRGDRLGRLDDQTYRLGVEQRDAAIRQARARLQNAEIDYDRKAALQGTGAIAQSAIDAALSVRDTARETLSELEASRGVAAKNQRDAVLRAPFDGRVLARRAEPGQTVAAGAPVLSVADGTRGLRAEFSLSERDISGVELGQTYTVRLLATGESVSGEVVEIAPDGATSLAFPVALSLPEETVARAGMSAELVLTESRNVPVSGLSLPATALLSAPQGAAVIRLDGDVAQRVPVRVLATTDRGIVLSGVSERDRIVTRGAALIRDGQTVVPLDPDQTRYPE